MAAVLLAACSSSPSSEGYGGSGSTGGAVSTPATAAPVTSSDGTNGSSGASVATDPPVVPGQGRCIAHVDDADDRVRVVVWEIFGGEEAPRVFEELVTEFRAEHPGIELVVEPISGANQLLDTLQQTPPDQWPDAVVASPQALRRLVDTGRVVPPAECSGGARLEDGLLPVVDALYRYRGITQGVPYGVSTPVLYFDAAEFRAAGLDPDDPPTTLEELAAASEQLVRSAASPYGLVVTDWYAHYLLLSGAVQRRELVLEPGNGRAGGDVTTRFDTPGNRAAMTWLLDTLRSKGGLWLGVTPSGFEDLARIAAPVDGGTMAIHTSGSLGDVIAVLDAGTYEGLELGIGPMPGPAGGAIVGGNGWFLIDHDDPRRVGAAFELVEWLSASDRLARLVVATGYIPPRIAVSIEPLVVEAWKRRPQLRVGFDQILAQPADAAAAGPLFGPNLEVDNLLFAFTTSVVEGGDPVEEDLAALSREVDALLARYATIVDG